MMIETNEGFPWIRRVLMWLWDVAPIFPGINTATKGVAWLGCRVYGHDAYTEVNGSRVCAYCLKTVDE